MPSLSKILQRLPLFCLLRDQKGIIRPALVWNEVDGALDSERYRIEQGLRVRILRIVDRMPEEPPAFEEVLQDSHIADVAQSLSEDSRHRFAHCIEEVCDQAIQIGRQIRAFVPEVPIEAMQRCAVQSLFAMALAADHGAESPPLLTEERRDFLRRQITQAARDAQAAELQELRSGIESARERQRHAEDHVRGLLELSEQLKPENIRALDPFKVQQLAGTLATTIHDANGHLDRKRP